MLTNIPPDATNLETESQYMILNKSNKIHSVPVLSFAFVGQRIKEKKHHHEVENTETFDLYWGWYVKKLLDLVSNGGRKIYTQWGLSHLYFYIHNKKYIPKYLLLLVSSSTGSWGEARKPLLPGLKFRTKFRAPIFVKVSIYWTANLS